MKRQALIIVAPAVVLLSVVSHAQSEGQAPVPTLGPAQTPDLAPHDTGSGWTREDPETLEGGTPGCFCGLDAATGAPVCWDDLFCDAVTPCAPDGTCAPGMVCVASNCCPPPLDFGCFPICPSGPACNNPGVCGSFQECGGGGEEKSYDIQLPAPGDIPDNDPEGFRHEFFVPDHGIILDLDVDVTITHTWVGDLQVIVEKKTEDGAGASVMIIDRPGFVDSGFGCQEDNYVGIILDDEATGGAIEDQCPVGGNLTSPPNYTPNNPLSAFDGIDKFGLWSITVIDNAAGDLGTLDSWSLHMVNAGDGGPDVLHLDRPPSEPDADPGTPMVDPTGAWHELWPNFCNSWSANEWQDNGNGFLDECDFLRMQKGQGPKEWYHVENVTVTITVTEKVDPPPPQLYLDWTGDNIEQALFNPLSQLWHQIWPQFCKPYQMLDWLDTNGDGRLSPSDQVFLLNLESGHFAEYHVDEVSTDIELLREDPPGPVCGDGSCDPPESCDSCPGDCGPCPFCGDGVVNLPGEECDGSDDAACPGQCQADCTCPPKGCACPESECVGPDCFITHNCSKDIIAGAAVACTADGVAVPNGHARCFVLADEGVVGDLTVTDIDFGVEIFDPLVALSTDLNINIYEATTCDPAGLATSVLVSTDVVTIDATASLTIISVVMAAPPTITTGFMVLEVENPIDGTAIPGVSEYGFWPGANDVPGACVDSLIRSDACGILDWTPVSAIGFPDAQLIINAIGTTQGPGVCGPGNGDCCAPNGTPGCDNEACCEAICALDPFCCNSAWDTICTEEAAAEPLCGCGQPVNDFLSTCGGPDGNFVQFGGGPEIPAIPADFFGPGSDPFAGGFSFEGNPFGPGDTDTVVRRPTGDPFDISDPPSGVPVTIPIEIVQLSLVSLAPITVTFNGGQNPEEWDVAIDLSELPQAPGGLTATKTHPNGGTYNSLLPVLPRFTFTKVNNPADIQVLDAGFAGIPPLQLLTTGAPWVHEANPFFNLITDPASDFVPAVEETIPGDPFSQVITPTTFASPGGAVAHTVCPASPISECEDADCDDGDPCTVDGCHDVTDQSISGWIEGVTLQPGQSFHFHIEEITWTSIWEWLWITAITEVHLEVHVTLIIDGVEVTLLWEELILIITESWHSHDHIEFVTIEGVWLWVTNIGEAPATFDLHLQWMWEGTPSGLPGGCLSIPLECPDGTPCQNGECTPPPICGDGVVNQPGEECDGGDDAACPGLCQADCTCPPGDTEACCFPDAPCQDLPIQECQDAGGGNQGAGTSCAGGACDAGSCPPDAAGDCCDPAGNGTPGCDIPSCCECVCAFDPFCCDSSWDSICAGEACTDCATACSCCGPDCGSCPTDVNGDGNTGPLDLANLLAQWGPTFPGNCLDANGNGIIDPFDLATLLANWGPCPPCTEDADCPEGEVCQDGQCGIPWCFPNDGGDHVLVDDLPSQESTAYAFVASPSNKEPVIVVAQSEAGIDIGDSDTSLGPDDSLGYTFAEAGLYVARVSENPGLSCGVLLAATTTPRHCESAKLCSSGTEYTFCKGKSAGNYSGTVAAEWVNTDSDCPVQVKVYKGGVLQSDLTETVQPGDQTTVVITGNGNEMIKITYRCVGAAGQEDCLITVICTVP